MLKQPTRTFSTLVPLFLGTMLEWYDFSVFAFLAPTLSTLFFPAQSPLASFLWVYGLFAVSFLVRPLGALVLGRLGDRIGRKQVLVFSMGAMSLSTLATGLLPTWDQIGILAPILLILLRLVQGFCVGGETTGSASFVLESFPGRRRGFLGSVMWSAVGTGMLASSLVTSLLANMCSEAYFRETGWRIPFILGVLAGVSALILRRKIPETALFSRQQDTPAPALQVFATCHRPLLTIMGLYALSAIITYVVFVFMPVYVVSIIPISAAQASLVTTCAIAAVTLLMPLAGLLSDRFGRKPCLLTGAGGFTLLSYPLYVLMTTCRSITGFLFAQGVFIFFAALYQGALTTAAQELATTRVRLTITSTGYNLSFALFGGTSPLIVAWMLEHFSNKSMPGLYLTLGGVFALFAISRMQETARTTLV